MGMFDVGANPTATKFGGAFNQWTPAPANSVSQTVNPGTQAANLADYANSGQSESPSPVTIIIGLLVIAFLLKVVSKVNGSKIEPYHIDLGPYNITAMLCTTIGGIAILKVLLNKWPMPGATALINFV